MTTSVQFQVLMRQKIKFPSDFVTFNEKILIENFITCAVFIEIQRRLAFLFP